MNSKLSKFIIDQIFALTALLVFSPIMAFIAVLVFAKLGPPIFFIQMRPGLDGKPFNLIKFRTMKNLRDSWECLLPDTYRMTALGKFLRKFSLDELPELFNVVRGELSIVGPRPLLMQYLNRYTPEQARRHKVKPGITGWAQVHGRNAITWEEKFRHDLWYVENSNLWLDLKIILMTFLKVIRGQGISQPGHVTMGEFKGECKNNE